MGKLYLWHQFYLLVRFKFMPFTKHRDDILIAEFGNHMGFGTGRLDQRHRALHAIFCQFQMFGANAIDDLLLVFQAICFRAGQAGIIGSL